MTEDFLYLFEEALYSLQGLDEVRRIQTDNDGESGILRIKMTDGREYSVQFNRA